MIKNMLHFIMKIMSNAGTLVLSAVILVSCGRPWSDPSVYPYTTTDPVTDFGDAIQALYGTVTYIVLVVWVIVFAVLGYILWRFRDDGSEENPVQVHGNTTLEIAWTLLPVIIVIALLVPTIQTVFEIGGKPPDNALEIRVIGKRWWWQFEYVESGVVTANTMHVPAGRTVSLLLESDSIIHSFWVPRLGGKRDNVPGRVNRIWFTIEDEIAAGSPEVYLGQCAEYCGEAHALMKFEVIGHEEKEFDQWLTDMKMPVASSEDPAVVRGEEAFTAGGCVGCHVIVGNDLALGDQGPSLTRFGDRMRLAAGTVANTPENLTQWLKDPNSIKPGTTKEANPSREMDGMNIPVELTDQQISDLVAYLHAQRSDAEPEAKNP